MKAVKAKYFEGKLTVQRFLEKNAKIGQHLSPELID